MNTFETQEAQAAGEYRDGRCRNTRGLLRSTLRLVGPMPVSVRFPIASAVWQEPRRLVQDRRYPTSIG